MMHLLMAHPGTHHVPTFYELTVIPFFRRALRMPWRKPAAPAVCPPAGAGTVLLTDTPPDGTPVMRDRWVHEVREEHNLLSDAEIAALRPRKRLPREDGEIVIDERNHVHVRPARVRPVNGAFLGDLPRRTPAATLNRAPWETGSFTVPADVTMVPVYGETSVATVLEAERLAKGLIA